MHDSQVIGVLVDPDEITLADSAYQNQATPKGAVCGKINVHTIAAQKYTTPQAA